MPFADMFQEVAAILFLAVTVGALSIALRQPLIVAFLAVGILVGPGVLGWVTSADMVGLLADVGIALLLFVVGLRLYLGLIRSIGRVSAVTGLGQVVVYGLGRYGSHLARGLAARGVAVLGVDFDPQAVAHARAHGLEARYGDAEDPEFPSALPLGQAR